MRGGRGTGEENWREGEHTEDTELHLVTRCPVHLLHTSGGGGPGGGGGGDTAGGGGADRSLLTFGGQLAAPADRTER